MFTFMVIVALILTVAIFIFLLPKWRDGTFGNKFLQFLHDYFNFKQIFIEYILKFLFVFLTFMIIFGGIYVIFAPAFDDYEWTKMSDSIIPGLAIMILGPVVIRLLYEACMVTILMLKNVVELNNKTKDESPTAASRPAPRAPKAARAAQAAQEPVYQQQYQQPQAQQYQQPQNQQYQQYQQYQPYQQYQQPQNQQQNTGPYKY